MAVVRGARAADADNSFSEMQSRYAAVVRAANRAKSLFNYAPSLRSDAPLG
jgi:DNA-directed RNA polymerase subunit K/omega